ncbi:MAG: hypothetical protein H6Q89_4770 [Myxococcaceae bacterium]|nr:hypothetical protein [Myxococcaceae bacterium]
MGCDSFEMQIEQRAHGALPPAEQAALAAHLDGCADCRDFAALVTRIEGRLVERVKAELSRVDWSRLDREVALQAVVVRWVLLGFSALPLAALPWVAYRNPHRPELVVPFALFGVAVAVICWGMRTRWLRQWERGTGEDLLPFYRRWLDQRTRDARQSVAMCVATSLAIPVVLWLGVPPDSLIEQVAVGSAPVVLLGSAGYLSLVLLPRLRRERQALE